MNSSGNAAPACSKPPDLITHYAMFKLNKGISLAEVMPIVREYYQKMENEIKEVQHTCILVNCIERDINCDIMVILELQGNDVLAGYLDHPLHQALRHKTERLMKLVSCIDYIGVPSCGGAAETNKIHY